MVGLEEALIGKENVCQLLIAVLRGKGAVFEVEDGAAAALTCLLYTSPSPRD